MTEFAPQADFRRSLRLLWFALIVSIILLGGYLGMLLWPYNPVTLRGPMGAPDVVHSTDKDISFVIPHGCTNTVGKPAEFIVQLIFPENRRSTVDILSIDFPLREKGCRKDRQINLPVALLPQFLETQDGLKVRFIVKTKVNSVRTITDYVESEPFRYEKH